MVSPFQVLQQNTEYRSIAKAAKKGKPGNKYDGPDGTFLVRLGGVFAFEKNGVDYFGIEYIITDEDHEGLKLADVFGLSEQWADDNLNRFYACLQKFGIKTDGRKDEEIEADVNRTIKKATALCKALVERVPDSKIYNITLLDPTSASASPSDEESNESEWSDEETGEEESSLETLNSAYAPSEWDGYVVEYNGVNYCLVNPDDDARTCSLAAEDDPDSVEWDDVPFDDLTLDDSE